MARRIISEHFRRDGRAKKQYAIKEEAQEVALRQTQLRGIGMKAYKCPECDKWHVGQAPRRSNEGGR